MNNEEGGSGRDHGRSSLCITVVKKIITISICWEVFWFFCSSGSDDEFSIKLE